MTFFYIVPANTAASVLLVFPVDIGVHYVLSAILSQLIPPRSHPYSAAAKIFAPALEKDNKFHLD
jgi:hypothetical protein